jgi:hypothetical protein
MELWWNNELQICIALAGLVKNNRFSQGVALG